MARRAVISGGFALALVLALATSFPSTLTAAGPGGPLKPVPLPKATGQGCPEPKWPVAFEVAKSEKTGFLFAVSQPGTIVGEIDWSGGSVALALKGPSGKLVVPPRLERGPTARITYAVTAEDVRQGTLWELILAGVGEGAGTPQGGGKPAIVARGKVTVRHPPCNPEQAQNEFHRINASKKERAEISISDTKKRIAGAFQARVGKLKEEQQAKNSAEANRLKALISREGLSAKRIETAPPVIHSISKAEGQPFEPVLIEGSGLDNPEVFFLCGPQMAPVKATVDFSNGTQILTSVPEVVGVPAPYQGGIYVTSKGRKSNLKEFLFKPTIELVVFDADLFLKGFYFVDGGGTCNGKTLVDTDNYNKILFCFHGPGIIFGGGGNDFFLKGSEGLKNHWVVDTLDLESTSIDKEEANAYFDGSTLAGVGKPDLYMNVRYWYTAGDLGDYTLFVVIKGPKGVPYL